MARVHPTPRLVRAEEALTVLFCLVDDAYRALRPGGYRHYESLKKLSDSEVLALALFQQLRGVESERSFLRDAQRFFSHLFPGVVGLAPSSFHRRVRKLRRFFEPLRRAVVAELVGDPETLIVDSTLLPVSHPRQVKQSAAGFDGAAWARWGSFAVYGVKLHLLCATNRVPVSYELTPANTAEVLLVRELLEGVGLPAGGAARRLLGATWPTAAGRSRGSWPRAACSWRPRGPTGGRRSGSRWRSASRPSSATSAWAGRWRPRSLASRPGSRPRSPLTPTAATSTASWGGPRAASRSCGPDILATLI